MPKKEKARIIEQMQKVNSQSQSNALSYVLQNEQDVVLAVVSSHQMTCDLPLSRVSQMREMALQLSNYINCPANMVSLTVSECKDIKSHLTADQFLRLSLVETTMNADFGFKISFKPILCVFVCVCVCVCVFVCVCVCM